ncbi:unnamed protein product [Urochloa humidicola]
MPTISECFTCLHYFSESTRQGYQKDWMTTTDNNDEEYIVVKTVRELRSRELYHNDLTSHGLVAILEKLPYLESSDICNCRNIIMENTTSMRNLLGNQYPDRLVNVKTKKLTIKLFRGEFYSTKIDEFPCLTCSMSDINMKYAFGSKYPTVPKEKMKRCCRMPSDAQVKKNYFCNKFECLELDPSLPILECSTCLMLEYFAKSLEELNLDDFSDYDDPCYGIDNHGEIDLHVAEYFTQSIEELDLDDYSDYDDPSYGIHNHDEIIDFHVDDRMVGKRLRRYLKMKWN